MTVLLGNPLPDLAVTVRDEDGDLVDPSAVVLTVTKPDASTVTPTVVRESLGRYVADYWPATIGRYLALWTTTGPVTASAQVWDVDDADASLGVTLAVIKAYLGTTAAAQWSDPELSAVLLAETSAQVAVCDVPAIVPPALVEALKRRVARNLAMRKVPLGVTTSEIEGTRLSSTDPEIRRLEAPWRAMAVG